MRFDVITLFPEVVAHPFQHSLMGRAIEGGLFQLEVHDLRPFGVGRHRVCDDEPYGGGEGMVMKVEPFFAALQSVPRSPSSRVIIMSPGGTRFDQAHARRLLDYDQLILLCGHYEGVDERVRSQLVDEALSIGDFVLTGGELAAAVVIETVARLLPGVVGKPESLANECFEDGVLDFPQYTRPREFNGWAVPDILLSGHHAQIARWRRAQALARTRDNRPDLIEQAPLSEVERLALIRDK